MNSYRGKTAWLSTKHQKLDLIAPVMLEKAGLVVEAVEIDTDLLGTFSGEIPRADTPLNTAIAKAKMSLTASNQTLGLASEGSIGPDLQNPLLVSNVETVVFVDLSEDLVIHQSHRSFEIVAGRKDVSKGDDLTEFLASVDFPNHALIAHIPSRPKLPIIKGIKTYDHLEQAITELSRDSNVEKVRLETDHRAHMSPSRRKNIQLAATKLAIRLASNCPECEVPGFGLVRYETGLACESCGIRNENAIVRELLCCVRCDYSEAGATIAESLPAERCDWCNP